jgi:hypothetical protein
MRGLHRYLQQVRCVPCQPYAGETGGVAQGEMPGLAFTLLAAVRPDRQSERRDRGSLRPRERRKLFPLGRPPLRQGDHLYFPEDTRLWRCMQVRQYPAHMEIEVEVEG